VFEKFGGKLLYSINEDFELINCGRVVSNRVIVSSKEKAVGDGHIE